MKKLNIFDTAELEPLLVDDSKLLVDTLISVCVVVVVVPALAGVDRCFFSATADVTFLLSRLDCS